MNQERLPRVVVTGIGLISPVGVGTAETWEALLSGQSGIAPITLFDAGSLPCQIAGEVKGFLSDDFIDRKDVKKTGRFIQFTLAAADSAISDSRLQINSANADRVGVYVGSGIGGFLGSEREPQEILGGGAGRGSPVLFSSSFGKRRAGPGGTRARRQGTKPCLCDRMHYRRACYR